MNNVCTKKSACDKAVGICDQEEGMECNIDCCSEDLATVMIESDLAGRTPFYFTGTYVTYETKQCNSNNITLRFITYAVAVIV